MAKNRVTSGFWQVLSILEKKSKGGAQLKGFPEANFSKFWPKSLFLCTFTAIHSHFKRITLNIFFALVKIWTVLGSHLFSQLNRPINEEMRAKTKSTFPKNTLVRNQRGFLSKKRETCFASHFFVNRPF